MPAHNKIGIANRNEYWAASLLCIPNNNAVDIVIPEREIPGNKAQVWAIPIMNALKNVIWFCCCFDTK